MWVAVLAGLLVSVDALFIGVSLGSQKRCRFWHLLVINGVLTGLCFVGYLLGILIGDRVDIELDLVIGLMFITLGTWAIACYYIFERKKARDNKELITAELTLSEPARQLPSKNIVMTGLFMSVEAMFITIGLTLMLERTTIIIPLTVALAHFIYSASTFFFAKYLRRLPPYLGHIISGAALIVYGLMAIII